MNNKNKIWLGDQEAEIIPLGMELPNGSTHDKEMKDDIELSILPVRNMVLFPGVMMPISISRPKIIKLAQRAYQNEKLLAAFTQKDASIDSPIPTDLYTIGVAIRIVKTLELPDKSFFVIVEARDKIVMDRASITRTGSMKAHVRIVPEIQEETDSPEFSALVSGIKDTAVYILDNDPNAPHGAPMMLQNIENPILLINYLCANFDFPLKDKMELLSTNLIAYRATLLLKRLTKEAEMTKMKVEILQKTDTVMSKEEREYFLRHQMEQIQKELGSDSTQTINGMRERAKAKHLPEHAQKALDESLKRLQTEHPHSSEYATELNYAELLLSLPWNQFTEDNYDIQNAQTILDRDHYGMEKVKERIIEYLSVLKQVNKNKDNSEFKAPILCLYGPPGVGKTSLGKSIAESLGRKYARISLGGLHDEAEIRGHRKTYIGAMPGRIVENLKKVESANPVFVLDEIDKIGADYKGDPTSALLEVLDPEQNSTFHDNYLDVDFDLSKVLFIATANSLETIPRPLLDRMELIEMSGYLLEEKVEIARLHLIPKCLKEHGLKSKDLKLSKRVIEKLVDAYTRESGVRGMERQIAKLCRKVVTKMAKEEEYNPSLTTEDLQTYLGKTIYNRDQWETNNYIGVVTGLAWTQVGGEILFIEVSLSKAKTPTLTITGNLGDVMKESATIALGYVKAHAEQFGIKQKDIETMSVHIHVPEGAIPKDGPSAGITMTTALVSAFTNHKVKPRIAMTGEMTLRGKVLPIGGVKEKILAAKRSGITDLILCEDNRRDVEEINSKYLKGLKFHYVKDITDVISKAIEDLTINH